MDHAVSMLLQILGRWMTIPSPTQAHDQSAETGLKWPNGLYG